MGGILVNFSALIMKCQVSTISHYYVCNMKLFHSSVYNCAFDSVMIPLICKRFQTTSLVNVTYGF